MVMASSMLYIYLVGFLVLAGEVILVQGDGDYDVVVMEEEELQGLFDVLSALLEDSMWTQMHPQPCTDTPWPGVQCEIGEENPPIFHVTKIHIGPDIVTPPCKSSATLSSSFHKLPYLKTLSIFNCFVASPVTISPILFGPLSSLEHLVLKSNPSLSGEIPSSLGQLPNLRVLSLSQNNLQGNIPRELGGLVNLEQLDLSYNDLGGEVPEDLGGLKSLTILDLSWNSLEGQVPSCLGQLQNTQKIDLGSNRFLGRLPPDLGKLKRLVLLDLSHNFINGPIPETLSGLEDLQYLICDNNPLNSGIPLFMGTLKKLTSISLSSCGLTGPIPNILSLLKNLTTLSLDNNSLVGSVPTSFGSLPNLDQLNVSQNRLSGEITIQEEFIIRLGKRLDVRGNSGLCIRSDKRYNNSYNRSISLYDLEIPICHEVKDNRTSCAEKKSHDNNLKGMQHPTWDHGNISSNAPSYCQDQNHLLLVSCTTCIFLAKFLTVTTALLLLG